MNSQLSYFSDFLKVTPMALAVWRSGEAYALKQLIQSWQNPVLDLGCGFGEFMGVFYDGQIEIGLDIDKNDLIQAARSKKYRQCKLADARSLPFEDESIETVVAVSVMEHIPEVDRAFNEVFRVLKPGGKFVFTVPTILLNQYMIGPKILKKMGLSKFSDSYIERFHNAFKHINLWPEKKWLKLLNDSNFHLNAIVPTLTVDQLHWFEYGLPSAFPSQLTRNLLRKRFVVDFDLRQKLLKNKLKKVLSEEPKISLNIAIVGVKQ